MIALWLIMANIVTSRSELAEVLEHKLQDRPALFQSTPTTHFVPEFNTVTYAADAKWINTDIAPAAKSWVDPRDNNKLEYRGWVSSPYFALSLKKIGIGFNIEAGNKEISFNSNPWNMEKRSQISAVDYRGLGIYLFYKPFETREFVTSLTIGGKSLNAKHEISSLLSETQRNQPNSPKSSKYSYSLYDYSLGMNAQIRLVKLLNIIPWADYVWIDDAAAQSSVKNLNAYNKKDFEDDLQIFWHDRPALNYGIDFAMQLNNFEIRLGGLLAAILASGGSSDQITDQGFSIAVAWDHKG